MRKGRDLILAAMIKKDRNSRWQSRREVRSRLDVLAGPSSLANERRCDDEDSSYCVLRHSFSENIYEYRSAERVANEDGVSLKDAKLLLKGRLPSRLARIG